MAIPNWSGSVPFIPMRDTVQVTPFGPGPIVTEMEGGNVRVRRRPGDDVKIVTQTVRMTRDQVTAFDDWYANTIGGGTGRFKVDVWNGSEMVNKVCQFHLQQGGPKYQPVTNSDLMDVTMYLRVYS